MHSFAFGGLYITSFPRSVFDEGINFLHCSWTLVTQENRKFMVYFLLMSKSVCVCVLWG